MPAQIFNTSSSVACMVVQGRLIAQGVVEPTDVQREAIPPILTGTDVAVQCYTGSGKVRSLDIAHQVHSVFVAFSTHLEGVRVCAAASALCREQEQYKSRITALSIILCSQIKGQTTCYHCLTANWHRFQRDSQPDAYSLGFNLEKHHFSSCQPLSSRSSTARAITIKPQSQATGNYQQFMIIRSNCSDSLSTDAGISTPNAVTRNPAGRGGVRGCKGHRSESVSEAEAGGGRCEARHSAGHYRGAVP